jgi:UDP-2,3-diacylglucosamine pyrophosphatase LpxH
MKRKPEIVILSDLHLGTYGCRSKELLQYLKSVQPNTLILNGDIIDIWQFKKQYFPTDHLAIIQRIIKMAVNGTKVYYLTGNHDDLLRKFSEVSLGAIQLRNKLVFQIDNKSHWVFHGDVFDASIQKSRWLAKLGGEGYEILIRINRSINNLRELVGLGPVSFSANIKKKVKGAVKHISNFEETAISLALDKGYDYVICGHIHQPQMRTVEREDGNKVTYMNSGDWIENLTALEYQNGKWEMFKYDAAEFDEGVSKRLRVPQQKGEQSVFRKEEAYPDHARVAAFDLV